MATLPSPLSPEEDILPSALIAARGVEISSASTVIWSRCTSTRAFTSSGPGGGARSPKPGMATSRTERWLVSCSVRTSPSARTSRRRSRHMTPPSRSARAPVSADSTVAVASTLPLANSYRPDATSPAGPSSSLIARTARAESSRIASPVSEKGPRSARANGPSGRPGAAPVTRTVIVVSLPSRCQRASPFAVATSPAATLRSIAPAAASPLATRCALTRSRSGRSSTAAITPPREVSSTEISPSTVRRARSNRMSALTSPVGPSRRLAVRCNRLSAAPSASNALPCTPQRESTPPPTGAARWRSSIDRSRRSIPSGRENPPSEAAAGVLVGSGERSTSRRRAATVSICSRPRNRNAKDQRIRASSTRNHGPRSSATAICSTRRSVGKKPESPDSSTRLSSVDARADTVAANHLCPGTV